MTTKLALRYATFLLATGALALSACNKQPGDSAGRAGDSMDSRSAETAKPPPMGSEQPKGIEQPKDSGAMPGAAAQLPQSDMLVSEAVKNELARDAQLSATPIEVEVKNGQVALKGSAPSAAARERATALASAVRGVTGVNNQLTVRGS